MSSFVMVPEPWWVDPVFDYAQTGDFEIVGTAFGPKNKGSFRFDEGALDIMDTLIGKHPEGTREAVAALIERLYSRGVTRPFKRKLADTIGNLEIDQVRMTFNAETEELEPSSAVVTPRSLEQWGAFTLAALIEDGYGDRLARCQLPRCGKIFVEWNRSKQRYCSKSHGSQVRQKRSREGRTQ